MDLFVTATRKKFRYQTERGQVTTEDLWDMPLSSRDGFNLDTLAIQLSESAETKSFVRKRTTEGNVNQQKFEIVKFVIDTKLEEIERAEKAAQNKEKRQKLLAVLENKEASKLSNMSEEEILKELEKL